MFLFSNLKRATNIGSGIADCLYFAPVSWFTTIAAPTTTPINRGDEITIFNDHIFKPGKGFITIDLTSFKNELTAKTINELPSQTLEINLHVFIPGTSAELHQAIKNMLNEPIIALSRDAECSEEIYYQLGSRCRATYISADFETGTVVSGIKGYMVTVTWINKFIELYEGNISKFNPPVSSTTAVFLANLNTPDISGNVTELEAFYNDATTTDINQIYQSIVTNAASGIIQLSFANDNGDEFSDCIIPVDLSSQNNFITSIYNWLTLNGDEQFVQLVGTELQLVDNGAALAYLGISIPTGILGYEENGDLIILKFDDKILIDL